MADIKWIKLDVSMPDNRKIKRIRKLPDGNNIILFWVFLLARAGETNQRGALFFTDSVPYTEEDLAADFDFTIEFTRFALITLERYRMVDRYDEIIFIKNWDEYQQKDKLEKIQEQNRVRQENFREKQKNLANSNVTVTLAVTDSNATELELELELEKDNAEKTPAIPYSEIIKYLNEKTGRDFRNVASNKNHIKARWNEGYKLDDFKTVIDTKCDEWLTDEKMNKFLQPSTVFGPKFDQYLNQNPLQNKGNPLNQELGYFEEMR